MHPISAGGVPFGYALKIRDSSEIDCRMCDGSSGPNVRIQRTTCTDFGAEVTPK